MDYWKFINEAISHTTYDLKNSYWQIRSQAMAWITDDSSTKQIRTIQILN